MFSSQFISRFLHYSNINYGAIHKTLKKVMAKGRKKRKLTFEEYPTVDHSSQFRNNIDNKYNQITKRATVLNKMFMRYITDLMVNGETWEKYTELGIQVTSVQISPDYRNVNIFWVSNKNLEEDNVEKFLSDNAFKLRHDLSQLRVMGSVPPIHFIKDKHNFQLLELDKRIKLADYGDDYESSALDKLKHQLELYTPLQENIKKQLEKLEGDNDDSYFTQLPEMPQNVFGLDHADILNRLKSKKTSEPKSLFSRSSGTVKQYDLDSSDKLTSREAFKSFLEKRKLDSKKFIGKEKNYNPDMECFREEWIEKSSSSHYDNIENNLDNFDDFIEDETESK